MQCLKQLCDVAKFTIVCVNCLLAAASSQEFSVGDKILLPDSVVENAFLGEFGVFSAIFLPDLIPALSSHLCRI